VKRQELFILITKLQEHFSNVKTIHVVRPNFDNGLSVSQKQALVEVGLDHFHQYDYEIINDGTLEELKEKVLEVK